MKVNPINFGYSPAFKADIRVNYPKIDSFPKEHADIIRPIMEEMETAFEDPETDNIMIDVDVHRSEAIKRPAYRIGFIESYKDPLRAKKEIVRNYENKHPGRSNEDIEELKKPELSPDMLKRLKSKSRTGIAAIYIENWKSEAKPRIYDRINTIIRGMKVLPPDIEKIEPIEHVERVGWNV